MSLYEDGRVWVTCCRCGVRVLVKPRPGVGLHVEVTCPFCELTMALLLEIPPLDAKEWRRGRASTNAIESDGLVIQCKWQAIGGSVDEKYPFEVLCINAGEFDTIIVLDGGGYSVGAEQWLRSQAGRNRLKHVFNQGEFQRYASRGNL